VTVDGSDVVPRTVTVEAGAMLRSRFAASVDDARLTPSNSSRTRFPTPSYVKDD